MEMLEQVMLEQVMLEQVMLEQEQMLELEMEPEMELVTEMEMELEMELEMEQATQATFRQSKIQTTMNILRSVTRLSIFNIQRMSQEILSRQAFHIHQKCQKDIRFMMMFTTLLCITRQL